MAMEITSMADELNVHAREYMAVKLNDDPS